jgi:anti-sigma factor RsiW
MNRSTQHAFEPEEIMAYLDGEPEAQQAAALASHLEHCGECQAVAAQLRQVSERLLDFQIEASPAKLSDRIVESIRQEGQPTSAQSPVEKKPNRRLVRGLAWAFYSALLLVVAWMAIPNLLRSRMSPEQASALARRRIQQEGTSVDYARVGPAIPPPAKPPNGRAVTGLQTLATADIGPDSNGNQGLGDHAEGIVGGVPGGTAGKLEKAQGIEAPEIRGPMIVQTASITIQAQNYDQASGQIQPLTSARSGYVQDMTADTRTGTARSVSATLRVQDKQLEGFLADLRKLGHVEQETRNNREVTDAYIDLTARLKTARATEQRVLGLLGTRTGKLSDVLEAEQELARIRGEIESMDGQRAHMEHEVRYATVQVQLNEEYREQLNPESFSTGRRLRNSLVEGLGNLAAGITGTAIFVFAYGPSILFWLGVIGIPAWFIWRRFRGTQKKDSNQAV